MRTVAYDLDGTLFSLKQSIEFFNELKNKNYKLEDIDSYNFSHLYGMSAEEYLETWISLSERIVKHSKLNKKILNNLLMEKSQGSKIIIVTARNKELDDLNKKVLNKHGIPFDEYYSNQTDKYHVLRSENASRFFDDNGELVENLMNTDIESTCELTIVDAPYNKNFKSHSRFIL